MDAELYYMGFLEPKPYVHVQWSPHAHVEENRIHILDCK